MTSTLQAGARVTPTLFRDRAFWGMTSTQFFGAFNDNLFKQLVMLICIDVEKLTGKDGAYQSAALAIFAIPFVLFSGFAGFVSDRVSKQRIVVTMKIAEIFIMLAGMTAFFLGGLDPVQQVQFLFVVLFLMSTHSSFFGPPKYGVLPELFADRDLPQANGIIQMTTFLAIIFGAVAAGYGKLLFAGQLWIVSALCVGIAVAGTLTSLLVRRTPIAHPGLEFEWSALVMNRDTFRMLKGDRPLMTVLLISSLFWFLGGVMQSAANTFGKVQLGLDDGAASLLFAFVGIGIAIGCAIAGKLSQAKIHFGLVRIGSWGLLGALLFLMLLGTLHEADGGGVPFWAIHNLARLGMLGVGFFSGLFIVPLQVFMQTRPPEDQKGRMIGAMNLVNWLAILLAAVFVGISMNILGVLQSGGGEIPVEEVLEVHWLFGVMALIMLPVAGFYHPSNEALSADVKPGATVAAP
jgi:acyl-[acyl-carrier-protein]-phospholipid O-acyltransferase/long-chain-fatty-acid--[acyl-carrier-protein] ligase